MIILFMDKTFKHICLLSDKTQNATPNLTETAPFSGNSKQKAGVQVALGIEEPARRWENPIKQVAKEKTNNEKHICHICAPPPILVFAPV
jgi:hypothetical protein